VSASKHLTRSNLSWEGVILVSIPPIMWRMISYVPLLLVLLAAPTESLRPGTPFAPSPPAPLWSHRLTTHARRQDLNCAGSERDQGVHPYTADASRRKVLSFFCATTALTGRIGGLPAAAAKGVPQTKESPTIPLESYSPPTSSAPVNDCDYRCREDRQRRLAERRALMKQSRSSTSRQDVLDLSRQRAKLYDTTYQGARCL
jgi:hypothetical protein